MRELAAIFLDHPSEILAQRLLFSRLAGQEVRPLRFDGALRRRLHDFPVITQDGRVVRVHSSEYCRSGALECVALGYCRDNRQALSVVIG